MMITHDMDRLKVYHALTYLLRIPVFFLRKRALPFSFQVNNLGYTILFLCFFNFLSVHGFEHSNISYVDECRVDCARQKDLLTCGKFRAVQWLHNLTIDKDIQFGSMRLVRLSSPMEKSALHDLPQFRGFGLYSKFLNFVRSSVEDMLTRRALVYTVEQRVSMRSLSSGPMILDSDELDELLESGRSTETREGRLGHKKKKALSVFLPLLILLKVAKLKLLLIPILLGVHLIKKILLIGAVAFTSILANLKYCKIPPMHHPTPYSAWTTAAEAPIDFSPGHEEDGWSQKIDMGYGGVGLQDPVAVASQRNPYRYYQALKQQQQQQFRNVI